MPRHSLLRTLCLTLTLSAWSAPAWAFCGFYVSGATGDLSNGATQVVLMRRDKTTVQSMQNSYEGPPQDFAMVIPVPVVLQEEQVKTLKPEVFKKIDQLGAPRLVEYWEQDPCMVPSSDDDGKVFKGAIGSVSGRGGGGFGKGSLGVKVEAQFEVGEYEIVILSAKESNGLEAWLKQNKYNIPKGAAKVLKPYVQQGMYFFVAKVNLKKLVRDKAGRYTLSPLRFHYESDEFTLPVRLGLLNAKGKQDLIVHILSQDGRYEVANTKNVTIPTNITVGERTRERFGQFYATLFDRVTEENPGAVVTEYAWDASTCDPCPGPTLDGDDYVTFGADVTHRLMSAGPTTTASTIATTQVRTSRNMNQRIVQRVFRQNRSALRYCHERELMQNPNLKSGRVVIQLDVDRSGRVLDAQIKTNTTGNASLATCLQRRHKRMRFPAPKDGKGAVVHQITLGSATRMAVRSLGRAARGWTLTRLHARYDAKTLRDDLVFKKAKPLIGGRGMPQGVEGKVGEQVGVTGKQASVNNFQGRYIILNRWKGKTACKNPRRGVWGGPIDDRDEVIRPATDLAFVGRAGSLKPFVKQRRVAGLKSLTSKPKKKR